MKQMKWDESGRNVKIRKLAELIMLQQAHLEIGEQDDEIQDEMKQLKQELKKNP